MKQSFSRYLISIVLLVTAITLHAQNTVSIGTTQTDNNAVLWLVGNGGQGLILPITSNIISMPQKQGMIVYNSADKKIYFSDGAAWTTIGTTGSGGTQTLTINGNTISISSGNSISLAVSPSAGQFYMFDGVNWVAKSLSQDVTNSLGSIEVIGLKGHALPVNSSTGFLQSDASGNLSWSQPPGGGNMSTSTYDTNADGTVDAATTLTTTLPLSKGGTGITTTPGINQVLTTNGTGAVAWINQSALPSSLPALSVNQLLSNNGSDIGITVGGDLSLNVTGGAGNFSIANTATSGTNIINAINNLGVAGSIAGNRILPSFGTQNISTSGTLSGGAATVTGLTVSGAGTTTFNGKIYKWPSGALTAGSFLQTDASGNLAWISVSGVTSVSGTAPITVTGTTTPVISLSNTTVASGTYGASTSVPQITIDAQGRITAASNITIPTAATSTTGLLNFNDYNAFNNKLNNNILTTAGDLLYHDGTVVSRLPRGANGYALFSTNTGIQWSALSGGGDMLKSAYDTNNDGTVDAATTLTATLSLSKGGTGVTTVPTNGQLLIGNGIGYTVSTLTASTGMSVTNASGSVTLATTGNFNSQNILTSGSISGGGLSIGATGQLTINNTGNITKINNVTTSFPSAQGAVNTVLTNDGTGNLNWTPSPGWGLNGNTATSSTTNFIGTTDAHDLSFRTNNIVRTTIASGGQVGIGVSPSVSNQLEIQTSFNTAISATNNSVGNGIYGYASNGGIGIYGNSPGGVGLKGESTTQNGVIGSSISGTGIYGESGSGYAGYFNGTVHILGNLSKSSGTFKIDHPLDPENKFLNHSFVESPDMMNVYNGNITTEKDGNAIVILPDYFESLNKDFRYQLTVIGDFAQVIVYKKIENNKFIIKTDKPNIEVSWQVTGIRKDPYAENNRVVPEVQKSEKERGKYLHPEAYGLPKNRGINYVGPKHNQ